MPIDKPKGSPKKMYIVAFIAVLAVAIVAIYAATAHATVPVVAIGDRVSVYYTGMFTNGTVFGYNAVGQPLVFTVGSNALIRGFEYGVVGMKLNETENITLQTNQAYGQVNQSLIITVPRTEFGNKSITVGVAVNSSSGQHGFVTAVNETTVTFDFNPPLAGKTLVFDIKVVAIQKGNKTQ